MTVGDDHESVAERFLAASPNGDVGAPFLGGPPPPLLRRTSSNTMMTSTRPTVLRRMTSNTSSAAANTRRTTTFSDFLSDDSNSGNSDNDDDSDGGDASEIQRMQAQADDMTYMDNSFTMASPNDLSLSGGGGAALSDDEDRSFRMSAAPPLPPPPQKVPSPLPRATLSRATLGRATLGRATLGRATVVRRSTLVRRVSTAFRRRKTKTKASAAVGYTARDGVLLDSDEDEEPDQEREQEADLSTKRQAQGHAEERVSYHSDSDDGNRSSANDSSFMRQGNHNDDDSFRLASPNPNPQEYDEEDDEIDQSFSSAMRDDDNGDDDDLYGGYDDEVDEQEAAAARAQAEEEEDEHDDQAHGQRLSEAPHNSDYARGSTASSASSAAQSFGSFSSAGGHFFVESVRGSMDSVAALMELPASPSPYSSSMQSNGSQPEQQQLSKSLPQPPPPPLSVQWVVDHTASAAAAAAVAPPQAVAAPATSHVFDRDSLSSSSSSSLAASINDASFSSNIDDSFVDQRPRSSTFSDGDGASFRSAANQSSIVQPPARPSSTSLSSSAVRTSFVDLSFSSAPPVPATTAAPPPPPPMERNTKTFSRPLPPTRTTHRHGPTPAVAAAALATMPPLLVPVIVASAAAPVSAAASPTAPMGIDTSMASSRTSDVRLDFTGVFMGDTEDPLSSSQRGRPADRTTKTAEPQQAQAPVRKTSAATLAAGAALAGPPAMRRVVSAQEASEIKVEEFFRKTYSKKDDDDDSDFMLLSSHSSRGRAKTSASRAMAGQECTNNALLSSVRSTRSRSAAAQLVDLKHIKSGQRIDDLLRANEEEVKDDQGDGDDGDNGDAMVDAWLSQRMTVTRKRTLSRPSVRRVINEELLEEHFPARPSTAASVALSSRAPPPPPPEDPAAIAYSVTSSSLNDDDVDDEEEEDDDHNSLDDSDASSLQPESPTIIQRDFTLSLASGTASQSQFSVSNKSSPNEIPMPPDYMLSPINRGDSSPRWSLSSANNALATPETAPSVPYLPVLSVSTNKLVTGGASVSSLAASKLGSSSSGPKPSPFSSSSRLRSPNLLAASSSSHRRGPGGGGGDVAPGFRWHPELSQQQLSQSQQQQQHPDLLPPTQASVDAWSSEDGSVSIKESVWHAAGALSIGSGRPSVAASVASQLHRVSANVKGSFHKARARFFPPPAARGPPNGYEVTSPTSICAAPPTLPRGFDDRSFYPLFGNITCGDSMIVVNKPTSRGAAAMKEAEIQHKRTTQTWLLWLSICMGIALGIGLIHVDPLATHFKLLVDAETGVMALPVAIKWLLLPGSLFLRVWNCISLPLLFCHAVNGIAELTMTQKVKQTLSFRAMGCLLVTSAVTTLEGIGVMLVIHALGLFSSGAQDVLLAQAASVKTAVGVQDRVKGMAALMCAAAENAYLQVSQNGQRWRCSNETIALPVSDGIRVAADGSSWLGSSPAVFAVTSAKMANQASYYPTGLASLGSLVDELINQLAPKNVADAFGKSWAMSIVAVGVLVGLVCGLRAYQRNMSAQHMLQQSQSQSQPTQATRMAESILAKPHALLGVVVELQLLFEWLVDVLQCLAPIGVAALLAGNIVIHRDEWFVVPAPVFSLILGVSLASLIHMLVISPLVLQLVSGVNGWRTLPCFVPALGLSFATGNVVLSVPVLAQNFASAQVVTKSMSQVGIALAAALHRSAHALYYPVAMLFLLETSNTSGNPVTLDASAVLWVSTLTFLSTFLATPQGTTFGLPGVGASSHLLVISTLFSVWVTASPSLSGSGGAAAATVLPLLVAADVVLGHIVAMVNTHDHVFFTRLLADHVAELCVVMPGGGTDEVGMGASPVYL